MKRIFISLILILFSEICFGQKITSGDYGLGLKIAFDNPNNLLTGYFENYSGWDDNYLQAKFSCVFYVEGKLEGKMATIKTYYPSEKLEDNIEGTLVVQDINTISMKLVQEHGGCWNVQHFADDAVSFKLEEPASWIQIRFVNTEKTYFYSEANLEKRQNKYLVKNDFVCIEKLVDGWAYCIYYGSKTNKGWIKSADLNSM